MTVGKKIVLCAALLVLVTVCFLPVIGNGFIDYDDDVYVSANPLLEDRFSLNTFRWAFTTVRASNWHPLTWLSHQADVALFGFDPGGHHLTSLVLHAANTVLLLLLLLRLTGAAGRSVCAAALFGIHPLHVESVAWVAERKDVLSTFFLMLTLLAYGRYAARGGARNYGAVLTFLLLGLLAKPMLVTVPILLLVLDFWPLGRLRAGTLRLQRGAWRPGPLPRLLAEKLPLLALALLSGLVTLAAQARGGAVKSFEEYPFGVRLCNALISAAKYLALTLWPQGLSVFYPHPGPSVSVAAAALAALLLAVITVLAVRAAPRHPHLIAGWVWYLVALAPVLGLVQVGAQAMADRYTYVPSIGIFVTAVWGVAEMTLRRWPRRAGMLPAAAAALLLPLAVATLLQVQVWRSSISVFEHALSSTERNYVAHDNIATALLRAGRTREAMRHALEALRIRPDPEPGRYKRFSRALLEQGLHEEAVEVLEKALRMDPADREVAHLLEVARARARR